ncbi:MAG: hypothetical protein P8098_08485 [Candidatus Thiodiazotropha sp.]
MNALKAPPSDRRLRSLKQITTLVYILQAASFLIGVTFLVALIINYVKRPDVEGTFLASHFTWQIRTFWYGLLWGLVGIISHFLLIGYLILAANTVWILYRIIKGWLRLQDDAPLYRA